MARAVPATSTLIGHWRSSALPGLSCGLTHA
jgi:hypothetical protein